MNPMNLGSVTDIMKRRLITAVRESKFVTFVTVKVLLCGKMVLNSQMVIGSMSNLN